MLVSSKHPQTLNISSDYDIKTMYAQQVDMKNTSFKLQRQIRNKNNTKHVNFKGEISV